MDDGSTGPGEHRVVELCGGPLDGMRLPLEGPAADWSDGVAMVSPHSAYGPGGRSCYGPDPQCPASDRWVWEGDVP
jgi:hypothetical protein